MKSVLLYGQANPLGHDVHTVWPPVEYVPGKHS